MMVPGPDGSAPVRKFSDGDVEGLVQKFPAYLSQQAANMVPRGTNAVRKAAFEKGEDVQVAVATYKAEQLEKRRLAAAAARTPPNENDPPSKRAYTYTPRGSINVPSCRRATAPMVCAPSAGSSSSSATGDLSLAAPLPPQPLQTVQQERWRQLDNESLPPMSPSSVAEAVRSGLDIV